jgi:hypothetical protein
VRIKCNLTNLSIHSGSTGATSTIMRHKSKSRKRGHKPYILKTFNFRNLKRPQQHHKLGNFIYYHDIWSNLHYGYVGTAAGFSESELLDGAGIEQIGSKLLKMVWSSSNIHFT